MIQGTGSNVGKSVLVAGLCRIFLQDGYRVAPFKSQNMALNSYVTRRKGEMGRAQVVQAQACRLEPDVKMNPILLKPTTDVGSQVIFMGQPVDNMTVEEYIRYKREVFPMVVETFDELARENDIVVMEGAGSPAEINLKEHDIVNMKMARAAGAGVILTGDIDRGGVFASLVGTMELLEPGEREKVKGFLINKFRGREELLKPGLDFLARKTGRDTLGVIPYIHKLGLPQEDSVEFKSRLEGVGESSGNQKVNIAILDLAHISNFSDFDPLYLEPDVAVSIIRPGRPLGRPDAVIIPGSKNVISDLENLRSEGRGEELREFIEGGGSVVGICGGYQIMGETVKDPHRMESSAESAEGLGLLKVTTSLSARKTLTQVEGVHLESGLPIRGYEIHHGETERKDMQAVFAVEDGRTDGSIRAEGNAWGTYIHGIFDEDAFRRWFIDRLRERKGFEPLVSIQARYELESEFNRLADLLRRHIDMDKIYAILGLPASKLEGKSTEIER
jgi:cobyric acid synthase CobQ